MGITEDRTPGVRPRACSSSALPKLARWFLASALGLLVLGCGASGTAPATSARAVDPGSRFQLDFSLPRTNWTTSDSITGQAALSFLGSGDVGIADSEFILFEFDEVGGGRRVTPVSGQICTSRQLGAGRDISSPITKSGGWLPSDPNAAFLQSFFAAPQVRLPAGDWTLTAVASFSEQGCGGPEETLRASVVVHVTD